MYTPFQKLLSKPKYLKIIVWIILLILVYYLPPSAEPKTLTIQSSDQIVQQTTSTAREYLVTNVIDGDTIEIEGGQRIRYIGIDTPETVKPNSSVECFGKEASTKNKELVEGQIIRVEKDVSETDKYGRLLRYVWVGDIFVNDYLVKEGYANAASFPPDVKHQDQFRMSESEARAANKGLWSFCALNSQ